MLSILELLGCYTVLQITWKMYTKVQSKRVSVREQKLLAAEKVVADLLRNEEIELQRRIIRTHCVNTLSTQQCINYLVDETEEYCRELHKHNEVVLAEIEREERARYFYHEYVANIEYDSREWKSKHRKEYEDTIRATIVLLVDKAADGLLVRD